MTVFKDLKTVIISAYLAFQLLNKSLYVYFNLYICVVQDWRQVTQNTQAFSKAKLSHIKGLSSNDQKSVPSKACKMIIFPQFLAGELDELEFLSWMCFLHIQQPGFLISTWQISLGACINIQHTPGILQEEALQLNYLLQATSLACLEPVSSQIHLIHPKFYVPPFSTQSWMQRPLTPPVL